MFKDVGRQMSTLSTWFQQPCYLCQKRNIIDSVDSVFTELFFRNVYFEITQPRGDRCVFSFAGALVGCELNTYIKSFDLFSEADHRRIVGKGILL